MLPCTNSNKTVRKEELFENIPGLTSEYLKIIDYDKMILDLSLFEQLFNERSKLGRIIVTPNSVLEELLEYIKRYLDLIISMFEGNIDESINQIKNLGFSEAFCREILEGDIIEVIKIKVWKIFLNIYLKFPKTVRKDLPVFFE